MDTPLQLIHAALEKKYNVKLPLLTPSRICFGFGLSLTYCVHQCDVEVDVLWQKTTKKVCVTARVNGPALPDREGIEEFLESLAPVVMPYLSNYLPSAGSGRILPTYPDKDATTLVASYLGMVPCNEYLEHQVMAHVETSTKFLGAIQGILKEAVTTNTWPTQKDCAQIMRREDAEYDFLQSAENEIKAAKQRNRPSPPEDVEIPTLN